MHVRDLIVDHETGRIRESKVWSNVAKASMTTAFLWVIFHGGSSEWLWVAYGGTLLTHESATRILNQKEKNESRTVEPKSVA